MAPSGALNNKYALRGALLPKASLETTNLALHGALWYKAPLCGALEGKPDFELKNSEEHYYTHGNNKIGAVRRIVAQSGDVRRA